MQRGLQHLDMQRRKTEISEIYSTDDLEAANYLLRRNNVDLIIVGKVERDRYPHEGLEKFDQYPEFFVPLYRSGGAAVYTTYFSRLNPKFKQQVSRSGISQ